MAKVELEKIRLAVTAIGQKVVATIPNKAGTIMLHKHNVHSDFLKCILEFGANSRFDITDPEKVHPTYEVAVVDKKGYEKALYSRRDVLKLLDKAISEGLGKGVSLAEFETKHLK